MVFKPQTFHNGQPAGAGENPDLEPLERRVAEALAVSEGLDAVEVTVTVSGQEIFLRGYLGSRDEIDRAIEVALAVPGVEKVTVNLHADQAP